MAVKFQPEMQYEGISTAYPHGDTSTRRVTNEVSSWRQSFA